MLRQTFSGRIRLQSKLNRACLGRVSTTATPADATPETSIPSIQWITGKLSSDQIHKVDHIFHRLLWLDMVEIAMLTEVVNHRLGIQLTSKQRKALQKQMEQRTTLNHGEKVAGSSDGEAAEEEATPMNVDLKLVGFDAKAKIKIIKEVRTITGLGLKEAKELVEGVPKVIQKDMKIEQAEELKHKLEELGAQIEFS